MNENKVQCNCEGWIKSMKQIYSAQMLAAIHSNEYTGDVFKYCPWCGRCLIAGIDKKKCLKIVARLFRW